MQEAYLDPQFLRIVKYAKSGKATMKGLLSLPDVKVNNGKKSAFLKILRVCLKKVKQAVSRC